MGVSGAEDVGNAAIAIYYKLIVSKQTLINFVAVVVFKTELFQLYCS